MPAVTWHVSALFALSGVIFSGVFFSADSFPGDFPDVYYTLPAYWIASITAGEWPAWIPYVGMGMPLGAIPQSSILYPPLWIFPALHLPYTLKAASVLQVLHIWMGAVGTYALGRRIFGSPGVALVAGSGYLVYGGFYVNAQHTDVVRAFALLPWLFWALFLPADRLRFVRAGRSIWPSALTLPNLALPAVAFLLATGGYPGQVEALVCVVPVHVVLQLVRNCRGGQSLGAAACDVAVVVALLGLGGLLASAFLVPLGAAWSELTRTSGGVLNASSLIYLRARDLYGLVLSSTFVRPELHRDIGMQLPLALCPFAVFVRARTAWLLMPFLGIAAIALVMALDELTDLSQAVIHFLPLLGYSRFPAGDYRTFVALAVLLLLAGGLRDALAGRESGRRLALRYVFGLGGLGLVLATAFLSTSDLPSPAVAAAREVLVLQAIPAILIAVVLLAAHRRLPRASLPVAIAALCVASAWPVLWDMREDWQVQDAERWLLNDADMKLWEAGTWRVDRVFQQQLTSRPARNTARKYPNDVSWNGYLNGEFLVRDDDGAILRARRVVEREPELMAFMQAESKLVALPCRWAVCDRESDVQLLLDAALATPWPGFNWQPLAYARSSVRYRVALDEPALVIENELYASGWRARLDGAAALTPVQVNSALRAWRLPAGEHELELTFETPWLGIGVAASAAAILLYALLFAAAVAPRGERGAWDVGEARRLVLARDARRSSAAAD